MSNVRRFLLVSLATATLTSLTAFAQSATAVIGNDLKELEAARKSDPENMGVRMRIAQRRFDLVKDATVKESKDLITEVEKDLAELKALQPGFGFPYKVLAKSKYRRNEFKDAMAILDEYAKLGPLDFEMRTVYCNALFALALGIGKPDANGQVAEGTPDPTMFRAAAEYIGDWIESDLAPSFGTMLGLMKTWIVQEGFRDEMIRVFEARKAKNPRDLDLTVNYAALLMALGRNESAWRMLQDAERAGLCDWSTGGRHPIIEMLSKQCPEQRTPESFDTLDLATIEKAAADHPENISLVLRAALINKAKAFVNSRSADILGLRITKLLERDPKFDTKEWVAKKAECEADAKKYYSAALPFAEKAAQMSKDIETIPLILGDIYYKLGRDQDAMTHLKKGVELVPYFPDLREGLASILKEKKDFKGAAEQLIPVCAKTSVHTEQWDKAPQDSLLPKPKSGLERMLVELVESKESRGAVIDAFTEAAQKDQKNPNILVHLAMLHYYAGNKAEASSWMAKAEKSGMCGTSGFEHELATLIASRTKW